MNSSALYEAFSQCPYCNEKISLLIDPSIYHQQYIEDCEVCCSPVTVIIRWNNEDSYELKLLQENEVS
ncbi:MAG: CPXCG motif-containing cysteine-rich protein [Gammaproteobacteria bacterium]|nr:CPXCG motif-containing cysteine-rich protein [Gammaproteobacteria bacterium]